MINITIFLLGLCLGSFLNVCIYRLPNSKSVIFPRSFCPACNNAISWYDNIPLLSYLILKGKCRSCNNRISFRYFLVEVITACLMVILYLHFISWKLFLAYAVLVSGLIVATFTDFDKRIIPDEISLGLLIVGFILSFIFPALHNSQSHLLSGLYSFLGILAGGGSILLLGILGKIIFKKESMGGGDVKLFAMIGAFLGWKLVLLSFFISPFFGSIFGLTRKIIYKDEYMPYGPFLSLGSIVVLLYGEEILNWVFAGWYF